MATLKERLQWIFRMALLLFALASVAFLSALMAMRFAIQGREVAMPDVAGKKAVEAQQMLQGRGVGLRIEDHIYSPLPVDTVVRQSPPAGMHVKVGQYAHVVLSLGPQKATIPHVEERSLRAARIELLRDGLQVGEISSTYLPGWQEDTVIRQDPAPGTTDVTSPHVNMLVSLGSRPVAFVMPQLVGLSLAEAESMLASAKLKVSKLTFSPVLGTPRGTVVGQSPARGARVEAGVGIEIQVAE
jgi:eukaryotic-like serine/threonine-protein kinase